MLLIPQCYQVPRQDQGWAASTDESFVRDLGAGDT